MSLTILIGVLCVIIIAIRLSEKIGVGIFLFGLIIAVALYFLPWAVWLPGTAVYTGDASWVVRHQAGVTFAGTLASIIGIAALIVRGIFNQLRPTSDESKKETAASEG